MTDTPGPAESSGHSEKPSSGGSDQVMEIVGAVLMAAGVVIAVVAYFVAGQQNSGDLTIDNLEHNEQTILAIAGLAISVVGAAVFLRYSLGRRKGL